MGPTNVKNQEKEAYKMQYVGKSLEESLQTKILLRKYHKVPMAYETLNPGLYVPVI